MRHSIGNILRNGADEISIHSFESGIYLVEAYVGEDVGYVRDEQGDNVKFSSVKQATDTFRDAHIPTIWLVEESAYDEMCGSQETHSAPLKVLLHQDTH